MKRLLPVLFIILFAAEGAQAQKTNSGTDFWMGFIGNYDSTYSGAKDSLRLYISASLNSNVTVSIPGKSYSSSFTIAKDSVYLFTVPLHLGYINSSEIVEDRGIHITSDYPVSVSAMNLLYATTDASIVLPSANIPRGPVYLSGNPKGGSYGSAFLLVAPEDSTKIDITPAYNTQGGKNAWVPFSITLNKGQVYQVRGGSGGGGGDLSGSIIQVTNNKKLMVFSGDRCSNYPCGACDHQYEQVMPEAVLDTAYLVTPHFGHSKGYVVRIIPLDTFTTIRANGITYPNVSRKNNLIIDVTSGDTGLYITGNKKFHCLQFMKGASSCNGYYNSSYGDPSMVTHLSAKYFGERSLFSTVNSSNLRDHYVNIIIRTQSKGNVFLDKVKVDSTEFWQFPYATQYSYAKIKLNPGQHMVECSDGHLAYCYGLGFYESYLYLAGFSLPNFDITFKDSVINYDCENGRINMLFTAKPSKPLKSIKWYFGDGNTGTGNPISHIYTSTGNFQVKMVGEDFTGLKDSVTRTIRVNWPIFDPLIDKVGCGTDTVFFEERNPFFSNFLWHDGSTNNYYKSYQTGKIKVTATDTTGFCNFADSSQFEQIDIFSDIIVDTIQPCFKYNLFGLRNNVQIISSSLLTKMWVIPNVGTWVDTGQNIKVHFPMPGTYKVFLDVFTPTCKARFPTTVTVYPSPKPFARVLGETFCSSDKVKLYDSSQVVTGYIKQVQWLFDDNTTAYSDSGIYYKQFIYNESTQDIIRYYKHIPITDMGCRDTVVNIATVWPAPKPSFTISPDSIQCLPNARWTYTSTSTAVNGEDPSLYWNTGNGRTGTTIAMKNIRYFNAGKYKVKLIATSSNGCSDSAIQWVEALALPKAKFAINDSVQCEGSNSFSFTDSSSGSYLQHWWRFSNGDTAVDASPDSVSYQQTGKYRVTLKIQTPYQNCADSVSRYVSVVKNPKADFVIKDTIQCLLNNKFSVTNKSVLANTYASALWRYSSASDTAYQPQSPLSFTDTGTYLVHLRITDTEGCSDSTAKPIFVKEVPGIKLTVNDTVQCLSGNRFVFRSPRKAGENMIWRINNQQVAADPELDSLQYIQTNAGIYTLVLKKQTSAGCADSVSSIFTVLPKPVADFITGQDSQCFNKHSFNLKDKSTATGDIITMRHYYLDGAMSTGTPDLNDQVFTGSGHHDASLTVTTAEGCRDSVSKSLYLFDNPEISILADSGCIGETMLFNIKQTRGDNITGWKWDLGDGNTSALPAPLSHVYNNDGSYTVNLTVNDRHGCLGTDTRTVLVYPLPVSDFTYSEIPSLSDVSRILFTPLSIKPGQTYLWQFPDASQSQKDTHSLYIKDLLKGKTFLTVTNSYGCVSVTEKDIYLYPVSFGAYVPSAFSPNDDGLNDILLVRGISSATDFSFNVWNRWGENIFESHNLEQGWNGLYKGVKVPEGVYVYTLTFTYLNGRKYHFSGTVTLLR